MAKSLKERVLVLQPRPMISDYRTYSYLSSYRSNFRPMWTLACERQWMSCVPVPLCRLRNMIVSTCVQYSPNSDLVCYDDCDWSEHDVGAPVPVFTAITRHSAENLSFFLDVCNFIPFFSGKREWKYITWRNRSWEIDNVSLVCTEGDSLFCTCKCQMEKKIGCFSTSNSESVWLMFLCGRNDPVIEGWG